MKNTVMQPIDRCFSTVVVSLLFVFLLVGSVFADPITMQEYQRLSSVDAILAEQIDELESNLTPSPDLIAYEKAYRRELTAKKLQSLTYGQWTTSLKNSTVVLLGDDHATTASQRNTVRVLSAMARGKRPLTLVIEWIDRRFQKDVDRYLTANLPLQELKKRIGFDKYWGFSWSAYSAVLKKAKELKVPILLVEYLIEHKTLAQRDKIITTSIKRHYKNHPNSRYLVVYGEFHMLGRDHLAHQLTTLGLRPDMVIVGEYDEIYWRLLKGVLDPDLVKQASLGGGVYFMRSGTPLERAFSYRNYLMELVGYTEDDFDPWIESWEIKPITKQQARFNALESVK